MNQKSRFLRRRFSKSAIAEVTGALLLILVVIAAVGSFAYFISTLQTANQNRSSFLSGVQNENLQITSMQLTPNNPDVQYEIYNATTSYGILMLNSRSVELLNSSGYLFHGSFALSHGYYGSINSSARADIFENNTIAFGYGNCTFSTATWDYADLTIRNLNVQSSGISGIEVNGNWLSSFIQTNQDGDMISNITSGSLLQVSAKESVQVTLNLAKYAIPRNESLNIVVLSSAGNYFTTFYGSPSPILTESVSAESSLTTRRDVPTFDGSQSSANYSSYIQTYIWRMDVPNNTIGAWDGSWANTNRTATVFAFGQSLQYEPEDFFSADQLLHLNITGPFRVTLTVVDSYGLMATSQPLVFSNDPSIAPVGSLSVAPQVGTCPGTVTVTVSDIFGRPLANVPVFFVPESSSVVLSQSLAVTNGAGQAQTDVTNCAAGGVLEIESSGLPPFYLSLVPT